MTSRHARQRALYLIVSLLVAHATAGDARAAAPGAPSREIGAYFAQWSVHDRDYEVADVHTTRTDVDGVPTSIADQLTFINYAFGNIVPKNGGFACADGDADADYLRTPRRTVDGKAVSPDAPLSGNYAQIKLLKAAHPQLRVMMSLGGWIGSQHFSAAASTDALRKQLADACVRQFIAGDLPVLGGRGGPGAARGVFDGIDIDWEFPGGGGMDGNSVDAVRDRHNFTLLMAALRTRLDAQGAIDGRRYLLTAAIGARAENIAATEPGLYGRSMDWVNVMTYDFHNGQEPVTHYHAPLHSHGTDGSTDTAVKALVAAGLPANKIMLGIPFYGRGWAGVPATNHGLSQPATGPAPGQYEAGVADYKLLVKKAGMRWHDPATGQLSLHTANGEWWNYDDPAVIATKMRYVREQGLRGAFSWVLDADADGALTHAVWSGR